mgnify:FL=1|jgi:heavy metal translocating P-type ATPase
MTKVTSINRLELRHKTSNRLRYYFGGILDKKLDVMRLHTLLLKFNGVDKVRFNKAIGVVVISYSSSCQRKIESFLLRLDLKSVYYGDDKSQINSELTKSYTPSLMGVVVSSTALVLASVVKNPKAKQTITTAAAIPALFRGVKELMNDGLNSAVMESAAIGISIYREDYLAANSTNAMLELGEYIEETTVHKSDDLLKELARPKIEQVWIEREQGGVIQEVQCSTESLIVGDIVIIGAGDTITIDGHVVDGEGTVSQVSMTGEADPIHKKIGDHVIAGTVVEEGRIKVYAEIVGDKTSINQIQHYISSSLHEQSSVQRQASQLAGKLVPLTLGLAAVTWDLTGDSERVASVLQADYSCALNLATPVAFKAVMSQSGKNGIMIKGAKSIEALHNVDTFIFDKTGTLTEGKLKVEKIISFNSKWSNDDILNLAASMEEHYFHPVAEAVVSAARDHGFVHMHHSEVDFVVAHGVKAEVGGKCVLIGSRHFLEDDEDVSFVEHQQKVDRLVEEGNTMLYISHAGELLGIIQMVDHLRHNAIDMINRLHNSGVEHIVMLTGDTQERAEQIASELGIDQVYAELKPTGKAEIVKQLKERGRKVAFVGDGINDAPALVSADVGFSMFQGADIAKATADIALLRDDIESVADARELADKTMKLINSNFNTTVGVNTAILGAATFGLIKPITTAVLHNGTTILLLLNSLKGVSMKSAGDKRIKYGL